MRNFSAFVSVFFLSACASRTPLFSASLVSMTKYSFTQGKLSDVGPVEARYCAGDPALSSKSSRVGMIDEVVYKAQKQKNADYIAHVLISQEGRCVTLEGQAMRKNPNSLAYFDREAPEARQVPSDARTPAGSEAPVSNEIDPDDTPGETFGVAF